MKRLAKLVRKWMVIGKILGGICGILLLRLGCVGQTPDFYFLALQGDSQAKQVFKEAFEATTFFDSTDLYLGLEGAVQKVRKKGYWLASIDSVDIRPDSVYVQCFLGGFYPGVSLDIDALLAQDFPFLQKKDFEKILWTPAEVAALERRLIAHAENRGYPLAKVNLVPQIVSNERVQAKLTFQQGARVVFDSITANVDSVGLKPRFFRRLVGIPKGTAFSIQKLQRVRQELDALPYLSVDTLPAIRFEQEKAYVTFHLTKEKANSIDGVVGILPQQGNQGGVRLVGNLNLQLHNLFASGKALQFRWERFQTQSQELDLKYRHPQLLGTLFNVSANLTFFQQDSSFSYAKRQVGIGYPLLRWGAVTLYVEWLSHQTGNTLSVQDSEIASVASGNVTSYGIAYAFDHSEKRLGGAMQGTRFSVSFQVGDKRINADSVRQVEAVDALHIQLTSHVQHYVPFGASYHARFASSAGVLSSDVLYRNEFFRLGGLQSFRGFNENAFFASGYHVATAEFHANFGAISFFPFFDYAHWQSGDATWRQGWGTGLGAAVRTQSGYFQLVYALGKEKGNTLQPNAAKIHFGVVNRF